MDLTVLPMGAWNFLCSLEWPWLCNPPSLASTYVVYVIFLIKCTIESASLTSPLVYKVELICCETLTHSLVSLGVNGYLSKTEIKVPSLLPTVDWPDDPESVIGRIQSSFASELSCRMCDIHVLGFYVVSTGSTTHNPLCALLPNWLVLDENAVSFVEQTWVWK